MVSVTADDVRDVINLSTADVPDVKVSKMIKRAKVTLAEFHYRSHRLPPPRCIFRAVRNGEVVGVIVYSYLSPVASGRKKVGLDKVPFGELNEIISSISRVVVHPKYRSIGLGQKLVRETLPCSLRRWLRLWRLWRVTTRFSKGLACGRFVSSLQRSRL